MFATLIAVVVALLFGHAAKPLAAAVRRYRWWERWLLRLNQRFDESTLWRSGNGLVMALLPPLIGVGLLYWAAGFTYLGLGQLALGVAVLFYCWGPRDLDVDVHRIVHAASQHERREAAAQLWPAGGAASLQAPALVGAVFRSAQRRWFGVLFWFLALGAVGALLYRLTALAAEGEIALKLPRATADAARTLKAWLDWPVAQLMVLCLAIVGNFATVRHAWKSHGGAGFSPRADFLAAAGRASVREEIADEAQEFVEHGVSDPHTLAEHLGPLPELRDAMSLVWRLLMLWLAVLAVFVLAGGLA